jgi:hypothetical protein
MIPVITDAASASRPAPMIAPVICASVSSRLVYGSLMTIR